LYLLTWKKKKIAGSTLRRGEASCFKVGPDGVVVPYSEFLFTQRKKTPRNGDRGLGSGGKVPEAESHEEDVRVAPSGSDAVESKTSAKTGVFVTDWSALC